MNLETIELDKKGKVAIITLNRPKLLNAVNEQLVWDFQKATEDVKNDDDIRVVILKGSGRGFSAGADLSERGASWKGSKDALIRGYKPFFKNIIDMPKPVIGSIAVLILFFDSSSIYTLLKFSTFSYLPEPCLNVSFITIDLSSDISSLQ